MPKADKFLGAFGLVKGIKFGDYTLKKVTSTHETIERFQEYQYRIVVVFVGSGSYNKLYDALEEVIRQKYSVKGVKNYYLCYIDHIQDVIKNGNTYEFHLLGHSVRE